MKRWVSTLLVLLLVLSLAGCGSGAEKAELAPTPAASSTTPESAPTPEPTQTPEPTPTPKTRPIAVDENGFISTGQEIADGFMEMLVPGALFKSVTPIVEKTDITWDEQYKEFVITCGLKESEGHIYFFDGTNFQGKDGIPSDMVVLSFSLPNASQEEQETFVTYARALIYLCSTCKSGTDANEILKLALGNQNVGSWPDNWIENDAMKYNVILDADDDGVPWYYLAIKGGGSAIADETGFKVTTGRLFTALESLISDALSDFYVGKGVSIDRYLPYYPEILELKYNPGTTYISPFKNYSFDNTQRPEGPEDDDDSFTCILINGYDQFADFDMDAAIEKLSAAAIYLSSGKITSYSDALAFYRQVKELNGKFVQDGALEYAYVKTQIDSKDGKPIYEIDFFIREISAYK